jgi:hypothetical protein
VERNSLNNYYYTVASLPMLFYDEALSLTLSQFIDICRTELSDNDMQLIENSSISILDSSTPTSSALEEWRTWEKGVRNELVKLRAHNKGWEPAEYLRENDDVLGLHEIAREAVNESSPLEGEDVLNRARWSYLDELETGHHFDVERLVVYCLKLQILERRAKFTKDKGTANFEMLIENLSSTG